LFFAEISQNCVDKPVSMPCTSTKLYNSNQRFQEARASIIQLKLWHLPLHLPSRVFRFPKVLIFDVLLYTHAHLTNQVEVMCRSNILRYWTGTYWTVCDKSWLFSWFFNPFQTFCQFQTYHKRYGRLMKRIWDINIVFSTSFVQNYKSAGKLVFAKFICLQQPRG
jgi:hypothetical protein